MNKMSVLVVLSFMWMAGQTAGAVQAQVDILAGPSSTPTERLVFWNRLGTDSEIENSSVGPGGVKQTGSFVQGVFGGALEVSAQNMSGAIFSPDIVPQNAGCIEFWAKASVNATVLPPDACIQLLKFENADGSHAYPLLHFDPNDGTGNGGLCARVGNFGSTGTGSWGNWTYQNALKGGDIAEWHHYALVWSVDIIPGHTDPARHLLVFVDGVLNTGCWITAVANPSPVSYPENGRFAFPYLMNNAASSLTIDNLKIWNYAKTDFSDRFDEDAGAQNDPLLLWNRLGSAAQVSSSEVGPDATLANGTFVPGPFGNAVELSVPNQPAVTLPVELMSQESGCIEFWAKMNVTPSSLTWGSSVILAAYLEPSAKGFSTYPFIHFNGNDGAANGGLCARLGGIGSAGTAPFSAGGWTYSSALKGADPAEWHHYAMVWSTQEIASLGTPTRRLAIFVDGALNTGSWGGPVLPPYVNDYADGGLLGLLYMSPGTTGNIAIDNVKIWNYAKTDFNDRFTEGDIVTYEVTVFNGSIDGATNSSFSAAETLNLHADTPPTGWHFANWTVVPEDADLGNGFDDLQPETSLMMPPYAITLTAVWEPNTYTVTFDADGGEVTPASKTITFDAAYGALPEPSAPPASRLAWLFGGWADADGQPVTDATLVATASDHTLRAVWVEPAPLPDPEASPAFAGEAPYDGYLYRAGDVGGQAATAVEGTLALNVSAATGRLSAKAATRGGTLNFRASAWDAGGADGTQHATLTLPGGETLALSVRGNRAWGTLSGGSVDGELLVECARNRFRDRADAEAQAVLAGFKGLYTAALPPAGPTARRDAAGAEPQGAGYLSVTLSTYGRVKFAGVLADGTRVSMAAQALLIDGCGGWVCVPFFSPLYGRKGWAGGLVWLDPETGAAVTDRELGWLIRWDCARGDARDFSLLLDLCGGRYAKPPALAPAYRFSAEVAQVPLLYPGGAALFAEEALPLGLPVTVSGTRMAMFRGRQPEMTDGAYDYSGENCALAKLSFSASTGLYKGTFNLYYDYLSGSRPRHRKVTVRYAGILCPVRGAAFADAPAGLGHCLVPDNSTGPVFKRSFLNVLDDEALPTL
jgi:hypothetical protein